MINGPKEEDILKVYVATIDKLTKDIKMTKANEQWLEELESRSRLVLGSKASYLTAAARFASRDLNEIETQTAKEVEALSRMKRCSDQAGGPEL